MSYLHEIFHAVRCDRCGETHEGYEGYDDVSVEQVERSGLRVMQVIAGCALLYIVGFKNDMHGTSSGVKAAALFVTAAMFPVSRLWIMNLQGLFGKEYVR